MFSTSATANASNLGFQMGHLCLFWTIPFLSLSGHAAFETSLLRPFVLSAAYKSF